MLHLGQNPPPTKKGTKMSTLRHQLQHLLNPLHLYCRMKEAGIAEPLARRLSQAYERGLYRRLLA